MKGIKIIFLFCLSTLFFISCKKDSSILLPPSNKQNTTTVPTTGTASTSITTTTAPTPTINTTNHIWYKLWNPTKTIYSNTTRPSDSLTIYMDSTNLYRIRFGTSTSYAGGSPSSGSHYNYSTWVSSLDSNVYIACLNSQSHSPISSSNWICDSLNWMTYAPLHASMAGYGFMGYWDSYTSYTEDYIGIKIKTSSGNMYGWIKLSSCSSGGLTMYSQALNYSIDLSLRAGQTH